MNLANVPFGRQPRSCAGDDGLAELLVRSQIIDLTHRYTWAIDTRTWSDLDEVFTVDATALLPTPLESREAIKRRVQRVLDPLDASQHIVTNHQVVVEGERASCRCQLQAQHVRTGPSGPEQYLVGGYYADQLVRTPDGWRIVHRELKITWTDGDPSVVRPDRVK